MSSADNRRAARRDEDATTERPAEANLHAFALKLENVLCELDSLRALLGELGDLASRRQAEEGSDAGKVYYSLYHTLEHIVDAVRTITEGAFHQTDTGQKGGAA